MRATHALRRLRAEDGFTIGELVVALAVLLIVLAMSMAPVMLGMRLTSETKLNRAASNLAQGRIEEIRSLEYADVGFPSSNPPGVLAQSQTTTVDGTQFVITTAVTYQGSATGLNIVAGGGDGVAGIVNTGVDYKLVTITVAPADNLIEIRPVVMSTIVAPPNIGAHEGLGNVVSALNKVEPPSGATDATWPTTQLVWGTGSPAIRFGGTAGAQQTFAGIPPNDGNIANAGYYYRVRLGPTLGDVAGEGWRLHPTDLTALTDRVHVGPADTKSVSLRIYKPSRLIVRPVDSVTNNPIGPATLYIEYENQISVHQNAERVNGEWVLSNLFGAPVIPGEYTMTVIAQGYTPQDHESVSVPAQYPTNLDHVETFSMVATATQNSTVTVRDSGTPNREIHGALVTFTKGAMSITLETGSNGQVNAHIPTGTTAVASSPYGHATSASFSVVAGSQNRNLATPAGMAFVLMNNGANAHFGYKGTGAAADDYAIVKANSTNPPQSSVVLQPGTYEFAKLCKNKSTNNPPKKNVESRNVGVGSHNYGNTGGANNCVA